MKNEETIVIEVEGGRITDVYTGIEGAYIVVNRDLQETEKVYTEPPLATSAFQDAPDDVVELARKFRAKSGGEDQRRALEQLGDLPVDLQIAEDGSQALLSFNGNNYYVTPGEPDEPI